MRFNFDVDGYFSREEYDDLMSKESDIKSKLDSAFMNGWMSDIDKSVIDDIKSTAKYVKSNFDCMVVIGIGGSYLGSYCFDKVFRNYFSKDGFDVVYVGSTLSTKYLNELINYLTDKNFCINVVSKSGSTMETIITYRILKNILKRNYDDISSRIIITTGEDGLLRDEVNSLGCRSFSIPSNIGGRYSFITPAHLFVLSLNYDIDKIIDGYYEGRSLASYAYRYAVCRYLLFKHGKVVENFNVQEASMAYFCEWLKQLFCETEGKNGEGILPISTVFTRDLHSIGQFIQDGNKILFETFIRIESSSYYVSYKKHDLGEINSLVTDAVIRAHSKGEVACMEIYLSELSIKSLSTLIYFFQLAAAFSGYLFGINPFDQPGVEVYKNEVKKTLEGVIG